MLEADEFSQERVVARIGIATGLTQETDHLDSLAARQKLATAVWNEAGSMAG